MRTKLTFVVIAVILGVSGAVFAQEKPSGTSSVVLTEKQQKQVAKLDAIIAELEKSQPDEANDEDRVVFAARTKVLFAKREERENLILRFMRGKSDQNPATRKANALVDRELARGDKNEKAFRKAERKAAQATALARVIGCLNPEDAKKVWVNPGANQPSTMWMRLKVTIKNPFPVYANVKQVLGRDYGYSRNGEVEPFDVRDLGPGCQLDLVVRHYGGDMNYVGMPKLVAYTAVTADGSLGEAHSPVFSIPSCYRHYGYGGCNQEIPGYWAIQFGPSMVQPDQIANTAAPVASGQKFVPTGGSMFEGQGSPCPRTRTTPRGKTYCVGGR